MAIATGTALAIGAGAAAVTTIGGAIAGSMPDESHGRESYEKSSEATTTSSQSGQSTSTERQQSQSQGTSSQQGTSSSRSSSEEISGLRLGAVGGLERAAETQVGQSYSDLARLYGMGPGDSDVVAGSNASRDLASMLQEYSRTGGAPSAGDQAAAQEYAASVFGARETELEQDFKRQQTDTARLSAQLGRTVDDPILQAKLRASMADQKARLSAERSGFASQFARETSQNRLNYATQRSSLMNQLASQAFSNRAALLAAGSDIFNQERNFRVATAQRVGSRTGSEFGLSSQTGTNSQNTTSFGESNTVSSQTGTSTTKGTETGSSESFGTSGGGLKGAITGGIAGLGAGAGIASGLVGMSRPISSGPSFSASNPGPRATGATY